MRCIGRRACFETRPGCAGPLLSMKQVVDGIEKLPHPEVPREARPRRTHDPTPAIRDSCPASQRNPPSVSRPPRWVPPGFRRTSPALRAQGAGRRATEHTPAARCARPRRARPRRAQPPPEPRPAPPGHARPFATIRGRSRDAPPGRSRPEAAGKLAPRAAAAGEACSRASPTTPARLARRAARSGTRRLGLRMPRGRPHGLPEFPFANRPRVAPARREGIRTK